MREEKGGGIAWDQHCRTREDSGLGGLLPLREMRRTGALGQNSHSTVACALRMGCMEQGRVPCRKPATAAGEQGRSGHCSSLRQQEHDLLPLQLIQGELTFKVLATRSTVFLFKRALG